MGKSLDNKAKGEKFKALQALVNALGEEGKIQHRGLGKKLMLEAEKIAKEEFDAKKILVMSGVGVREYFKNKFNYIRDGVYMSKIIK